jgi:hypothetical protein
MTKSEFATKIKEAGMIEARANALLKKLDVRFEKLERQIAAARVQVLLLTILGSLTSVSLALVLAQTIWRLHP